ncbi:MAG: NUDIX domain-containing protein [Candidatus Pacearchaeota archaeon]|jgi:8-oxo-dGTP pyrophosphatase MutT (NUDIX family)
MKKKFRRAVFIVAYYKKDDKINYLLLHRKLHWKGWEFPKGGIEPYEDKLKAAKRELTEETGLKIISIKRYPVSGKYLYSSLIPDRPGVIGQTYTLFSAEVKPGKISMDKKEHSGYKWVSYKKALELLSFPNKRKCIRIVDKDLRK